jgi:hypothetical protein
MVGTFGATAWEVQMKATWKMKPNDNSSAAQELNKVVQNAVPPPPHRLETLLPFPLDLILLTVPRNQNQCLATNGPWGRHLPEPNRKTIISERFDFNSIWR